MCEHISRLSSEILLKPDGPLLSTQTLFSCHLLAIFLTFFQCFRCSEITPADGLCYYGSVHLSIPHMCLVRLGVVCFHDWAALL